MVQAGDSRDGEGYQNCIGWGTMLGVFTMEGVVCEDGVEDWITVVR